MAALIVAHTGDLKTAERLCWIQLDWLARLASRSDDKLVLGAALQPWINLGRLRALMGDVNGARPHFLLAEDLRDLNPVHLGPCYLPASVWPLLVAADADTPEVLWNVYATDQIKAHLRASDYNGAFDTISRLRRAAPPSVHRFIEEGEILTLLRSGCAEQAFEKSACVEHVTAADQIAFLLHRVAAMTILGQSTHARDLAIKLVAVLTQTERLHATLPTFLRQVRQLGVLLEMLGEERYALAVYRRGLNIGAEYEDEPLRLEFTESALRLAPNHPDSATWQSVRDLLLARSLYFEIRDRHGMPPVGDDVTLREMIATIEAVVAS